LAERRIFEEGQKLRQLLRICVIVQFLCPPMARAQEKLPLKLIATTPMPGFTGDFDHFGFDLKVSHRTEFKLANPPGAQCALIYIILLGQR
jgi:hypothetical protein